MGIGDSIEKTAENAMEDLAGTSAPKDDAHVPEPAAPGEDIQVHSSISEGSNAMDDADQADRRNGSGSPQPPPEEDTDPDGGRSTGKSAAAEADSEVREVPRGVPGPAGLPDADPDQLRADPSEADEDPTTEMGRS
jgi:hypothetical protein